MADVNKETVDINSYTASFVNNRGKKIFCKYWEATEKPKALVFILHGFAEHCLPYDPFARLLASSNYFVFSHDHVGHGQSGGSRVHIEDFDHYTEDVFQHIEIVKNKHPDLPLFLCGHSMGGLISIRAAMKKPELFIGVVLVSPAVSISPDVLTPFRLRISRILRCILPHLPVAQIDYSSVTSCPKNLKIIQEDPLRRHGFCKAGFAACMIGALREIQENLNTITFPFLLLQGEDDKICEEKGAQALFEKVASKDKAYKVYPKGYHSLFLEPNGIAEQSMLDILDWLEARV